MAKTRADQRGRLRQTALKLLHQLLVDFITAGAGRRPDGCHPVGGRIILRDTLRQLLQNTVQQAAPAGMDVINLLAVLRRAKGRLVVVTNEFGVVQGLVTPLDVLEAIAGEFPDEDETPDIVADGDSWLVQGGADLHSLEQALNCQDLVSPTEDYASLAGFLLSHYGQMPAIGEVLEQNGLRFEILAASEYRIELVRISQVLPEQTDPE